METETKKPKMTFIDRVLNVTEARVRYLAKVTWIDRVIAATVLPFLPSKITPNQITLFRFATIPIIFVLFLFDQFIIGTIIFLFSAFSDAVDGALARTKNHITSWGILCDPLADKLLIGSVSVILVTKYIGPHLSFVIVGLELALVFSAYYRYRGKVVPAKTMGKVKMILQCVGIIFLLLFILSGAAFWLPAATYTLYAAVVFALLSLLVYRSV
jgi:CDP-diacylglycerol--glycerol-3-phosphate 3-phosphatidyltransferase